MKYQIHKMKTENENYETDYVCPECKKHRNKFMDIEWHSYKGGEPYAVCSKCQIIVQEKRKKRRTENENG